MFCNTLVNVCPSSTLFCRFADTNKHTRVNKKQQASPHALTSTPLPSHLPTSLGHLPFLPGEPSAPAHSPPTINTERTCSLLTTDVGTYPRLPITNSYSHRQQEIASVVFDPNAKGELHRRTQRPFLTNEANNTLRESDRGEAHSEESESWGGGILECSITATSDLW